MYLHLTDSVGRVVVLERIVVSVLYPSSFGGKLGPTVQDVGHFFNGEGGYPSFEGEDVGGATGGPGLGGSGEGHRRGYAKVEDGMNCPAGC